MYTHKLETCKECTDSNDYTSIIIALTIYVGLIRDVGTATAGAALAAPLFSIKNKKN